MKEVLIVYQEVDQLIQSLPPPGTARTGTVSVDEKPGVQAWATTKPRPAAGAREASRSGPRL